MCQTCEKPCCIHAQAYYRIDVLEFRGVPKHTYHGWPALAMTMQMRDGGRTTDTTFVDSYCECLEKETPCLRTAGDCQSYSAV